MKTLKTTKRNSLDSERNFVQFRKVVKFEMRYLNFENVVGEWIICLFGNFILLIALMSFNKFLYHLSWLSFVEVSSSQNDFLFEMLSNFNFFDCVRQFLNAKYGDIQQNFNRKQDEQHATTARRMDGNQHLSRNSLKSKDFALLKLDNFRW